MKPIKFKQANVNLTAPKDWNDKDNGKCGDLAVYVDKKLVVSCWRLSFMDKIKLVFNRKVRVWMFVHTTSMTQPPVSFSVAKTVFYKNEDGNK